MPPVLQVVITGPSRRWWEGCFCGQCTKATLTSVSVASFFLVLIMTCAAELKSIVSLLMVVLEPKKNGMKKRGEENNAEDLDHEAAVCTQVAICLAEVITESAYSSVEQLYGALELLSIGEERGAMRVEHYRRAQELPVWKHSKITFDTT